MKYGNLYLSLLKTEVLIGWDVNLWRAEKVLIITIGTQQITISESDVLIGWDSSFWVLTLRARKQAPEPLTRPGPVQGPSEPS